MDIGNIEGVGDRGTSEERMTPGTSEIEVEDPDSGEVEIFRLGVSGQWSKTGVKQRKKTGPPAPTPEATRRKQTAEEIRKGECFRCGRDNHKVKDCRATRHKDGTILPPLKKTPTRSLEEEAQEEAEELAVQSVAV